MKKATDFKSVVDMKKYAEETGKRIVQDVAEYRGFLESVNQFECLLKGALTSMNNLVEVKDEPTNQE